MISYTTTDVSNPIGGYYVENTWHKLSLGSDNNVPDTTTFVDGAGNSLDKLSGYHLTLFYKGFFNNSGDNSPFYLNSYGMQLGNNYFIPILTTSNEQKNMGVPVVPSIYGGSLPTDEELGKNLISGLNVGTFGLNLSVPRLWWGEKKTDHGDYWPVFFNLYTYGYNQDIHNYEVNVTGLNVNDTTYTMSVNLDDSIMPTYNENTEYLAPLLFTPILLATCPQKNISWINGIIFILGVEADS